MNLVDRLAEPEGRINHCMTSVNEFLIIYGGRGYSLSTLLNGLWTYNTILGIWKRYRPPIKIAKVYYGSSICAVGNKVYIFGGSCKRDTDHPTNSLISFDLSNATWKTLSGHNDEFDENMPSPMLNSFIFYHNGFIYVLGCSDHSILWVSMFKFCLKTSTWSYVNQRGQIPDLGDGIFGTVFKNRFYIFRGYAEAQQNRFETIYIFDLSTNTWTSQATHETGQRYPDDRFDESFAFSNNFGYLSGGENSDGYDPKIWMIDLETLEWSLLNYTLEIGLVLHCTSVVDDSYLYSFGGVDDIFDNENILQRFKVRPATLYRICLETIARSPNFSSFIAQVPPAIANDLNLDKNL
ncbi:Kelch domain-containing protein 10 [Thelohanellus kitauei]|uniref:Kelch domain-containing protein 10 n=1 Tax=Thelohanellus kitauei TaxID=669202 RepID=A0A0C2J1U3_THEKT|nr:Kelch domain-containing protein 10 [Thelohanellus kitauei]